MIAATMITKKAVWFVVLTSSTLILGITDFSCETERPLKGSDVTCKCVTSNNIEWQLNDVSLSICSTTGMCFPQEVGYEFQTNTSNPDKEYSLTVQGYDYSSCTAYSCTDINTSVKKNVTLSIAAFNSTSPSVFVEPGSNQNGRIEITTECLFRETDIVVEWYSVTEDDKQELYTPDGSFKTSTDCTDTCNGEAAVRLNIGFTHTEGDKDFEQSVKLRLKVYHKEDTSNVLVITTVGQYNITGFWPWWLIFIVVILCTAVLELVIGFGLGCCIKLTKCCCDCFKRGESCKECVNNYYCECRCCAKTPCGACCNIGGQPYWYKVLWASILGSLVALGIFVSWKSCVKANQPGGHDSSNNSQSGLPLK